MAHSDGAKNKRGDQRAVEPTPRQSSDLFHDDPEAVNSVGTLLGDSHRSSDVRFALIAELRQSIEEGKYLVSAEALAESILKATRRT